MGVNSTIVCQGYSPEPIAKRVLLFNPPVYDTRFPWSRWQQPVSLLQLATLLRHYQCDIRLIDALYTPSETSLKRSRVRILSRGDVAINYWRFGTPRSEILTQLSAFNKEGWQPDDVYIGSFTTIWWEGAVEAVELVRKVFPKSHVILYGAYPSLATEDAQRTSGADILVCGPITSLIGLPVDLSLHAIPPTFTYLSIGTSTRPSLPFAQVAGEFLFFQWRKESYCEDSIKEMAEQKLEIVQDFSTNGRVICEKVW